VGEKLEAGIGELEALYRERLRDFVRVAAVIAGDRGRGAEAVQEAFARAIRSRATFRGEAPLEAWVWRIVVNAARAARRMPERELFVEVESAAEVNGRADSAREVRSWIAALPERQRLAVFLRYFADLDYAAIAVALDVEVGTVSATLAAAHKALRQSLKEAVE
jgi:RNA polymerase sigma-70 factor (ECF subfamily)